MPLRNWITHSHWQSFIFCSKIRERPAK